MDPNNIPSSIFSGPQYRPYSPYQSNSFYLNASACSSMQYDPQQIHAHQQHIHSHAHHPHHPHHHAHHPHHHQAIGHSQNLGHIPSHPTAQNSTASSLDYFRAIHQYGYSAFSRDIEHDDRKEIDDDVGTAADNNNNNNNKPVNSSKSQSPNDVGDSSLQSDRDNITTSRRLIGATGHASDALSDDVIEESYESDYDEDEDEEDDDEDGEVDDDGGNAARSLIGQKSTRLSRPTTIYISSTSVLHSSVLNNDWSRAVSEHFQRSFALSKLNNQNFFPQDDERSNPGGTTVRSTEVNDHADGTVNDSQADNSTNSTNNTGSVNGNNSGDGSSNSNNSENINGIDNVHSDKENESPTKLESSKNRPFQKRLERRRRRQQKRLQLLYTPFRKRKLPANFFQPPSPQQNGCYYSNPYSGYNAGSSSNYYSSTQYNVTPSLEQSSQSLSVDSETGSTAQYSANGTSFYEPSSAFYDPLIGQSVGNEHQSSSSSSGAKVKAELEPNQSLNYSNNSNSSVSNVSYPGPKIRSTPLSLSVSMTIGGGGGVGNGNNSLGDSTPSASFASPHQSSVTNHAITPSGAASTPATASVNSIVNAHPNLSHRPVQPVTVPAPSTAPAPSSSSSSSAAAAAAAALATLNNDLTLDMSIHISPLTLTNHHAHHGQQQSNYNGHNTSHQQTGTYPSQHLVQHSLSASQQQQQQQQAQQTVQQQQQQSQQSTSNLSNLFQESHTYYYHHHHHQGANSGSHYQYASKASVDPTNQCQQYSFGYYSAPNPGSGLNGSGTVNQQPVIYPTDYSSMSRLHQSTPSTSNVATAAHIFSSLYSLAGQAGN